MAEETLFELPDPQAPKPEGHTSPQQARVLRPVRNQVEWVARDLDASLPDDHAARAIWAFLDRLDLSPFYASIKSVLGRAGHPTTDPQVLLALWLFATSEGIGSARQIDRLCKEHDAYRWLWPCAHQLPYFVRLSGRSSGGPGQSSDGDSGLDDECRSGEVAACGSGRDAGAGQRGGEFVSA